MGLNHFNYSKKEENKLIKKYIIPKRIVAAEGVEKAEVLLQDSPCQATLGNIDSCTIKQGGYILLDFGSELQGGASVTVKSVVQPPEKCPAHRPPYGKIRLVFGESVSEALSTIDDEGNALNDHSTRDMTVDTCCWSTMRYGNTGFRFLKFEAVDGDIVLTGIKGVLEYRDLEYKGSFRCNDELLNNIFDTAAYTVHLNMQEYIWDGIKRDRLVWIGDLHPEVSTICSVFGHDESVEKSLDLARDMFEIREEDIETYKNNMWMSFPSYTCWWVIIHRDWYMQNGNMDYLLQQKAYFDKVVRCLLHRIEENGEIHFDNKYFIDWSSNNTPYMEAGFRGCLIMGLQAAADICKLFGEDEVGEKCLRAVENVRKVIPEYAGNKQVCGMVSLSELDDAQKVNDIICTDLLNGLSTFYGYYVLNALEKAGNMQAAMDVMRGYWGRMLEMGATTFWEDFDIKWAEGARGIDQIVPEGENDVHRDHGRFCYTKLRHSLCHGWASGPAAFMTKKIIGVQVLEPGCRKIKVTPNLGDLQWAKGTYPTPYGIVSIEHRAENGKVTTNFTAPDEVEVVVAE
ncbi:MAG: alpha-L-rhamnosidase [Ruminococcaceae bacterium]|nr:alpha-L-rhamnosidase [Oscillospiraceae bacterium]